MEKQTIKRIIKTKFLWFFRVRDCINSLRGDYFKGANPKSFGAFGKNTVVQLPCSISDPSLIYLEDYVSIRCNFAFDGFVGKLIVKKYSIIARNCIVVTSNHIKSVGVPQYFSTVSHLNDQCADVEIGEDVWIGANCTLLPGSKVGRGCIVGACSLVNKEIPPYAVVVGSPCKIIGSTFTIDEILKHEANIYPNENRLSRDYLEALFEKNYKGMHSFGKDIMTDEQLMGVRTMINS